jgi:hypothetical protein
VTRQTFQLQDLEGNFLQPTPAYDPVSRVVRLCIEGLQPDQTYRITVSAPNDHNDPNGLRAFDGALLDPTQGNVCATSSLPGCVVEFPVKSGPAYAGVDACSGATAIDFCKDVYPIFHGVLGTNGAPDVASKCGAGGCHEGSYPAAGLALKTAAGIRETAINRVAQGSNTGSRAASQSPTRPFGIDMPIIDAANAPGDSWLVYKVLLAAPACSVAPADPVTCGGTLAPGPTQRLAVPWSALAESERGTLADWIPGREMPYPVDSNAVPGSTADPLTVDQVETLSLWILQGAAVPDCSP